MRKYLPLIVGLFLGVVSIIMGKIPTAVAQFSGMTLIGNHIGYLLATLTWRGYTTMVGEIALLRAY